MARYDVNDDLASAVRDVVQINRNGTSRPVPSSSHHVYGTSRPRPVGAPTENPFADTSSLDASRTPTSPPNLLTVDEDQKYSSRRHLTPEERKAKEERDKARRERRERRQIAHGQTKEAADKKGSRHADVIDTWDPTGLGSAMWHHSGPYDAAAPSRNLNQPGVRAPMQAFGPTSPTASSRTGPNATAQSADGTRPDDHHERRPSASATRPIGAHRRTSGGLSGQYSTSMPSSGGTYFPEGVREEDPDDEAANRRRAREDKRRALKAAWGMDTPEPFEDFGSSPRDETIDLEDHTDYNRGPRSPGMRIGFKNADEPILPPLPDDKVGRPGVKRTKSLMQKLKSMRDGGDKRSGSPGKYSPGAEYPPMPATETLRLGGHRSPARTGTPSAPTSGPASGAASGPSSHSNTPSKESSNPVEELDNKPLSSPLMDNGGGLFGRRPSLRPPIGPVMPDFEDLVHRRRGSQASVEPVPPSSQMRRKTSVVKKLKDRVVKA